MTATDLRTAFADLSDALTRLALADWLLENGTSPDDDDTAAALRSGARVVWTWKGAPRRLTPAVACECRPGAIADAYGLHYSGDLDAITHGGYFYSLEDWDAWGYADVVELYGMDNWPDSSVETLLVSRGTIDKREDEDMERAFRCVGIEGDPELRDNQHAQIDACKSYFGMGTDEEFTLQGDASAEEEVWAHVLPMLERIAPRRAY